MNKKELIKIIDDRIEEKNREGYNRAFNYKERLVDKILGNHDTTPKESFYSDILSFIRRALLIKD